MSTSSQPAFIRRLAASTADFQDQLTKLLAYEAQRDHALTAQVSEILQTVRTGGDQALLALTAKFDRHSPLDAAAMELGADELAQAVASLDVAERSALEQAAQRIRHFHQRQVVTGWRYRERDGTVLGQRVTPLERVGIYVPGGKAAYPSSVLMNAIPAKVAGVREIVMVVPTPGGMRNPMVLAAAQIAGVDRVFTVGGAQAVAALAYGTETIPKVDKITGPGNAWVAEAKRQVFGTVGIDMIAGPSEILVIADGKTPADWVAMDLFSQAEHDELAQSILISPDLAYLDAVERAMKRLLETMPRATVIATALRDRGALIHVQDLSEACELANQIAPEHLELSVEDPEVWVEKIHHAGAIFMGRYTSESLGDYCAGPNHVLPTAGTARFSSPLGVYDFQKRTSLIAVTAAGAVSLGEVAATLAYGEGLDAHARSAEYRVRALTQPSAAASPTMLSDAAAVISSVIRDEVQAARPYQVADATGMLKLDAMESPYSLSPALQTVMAQALADVALHRYPPSQDLELEAALRAYAGIPDDVAVMFGNGSDELIDLLIRATCQPGEVVMSPVPSFVMYEISAQWAHARFEGFPLRSDFSLDVDAFIAAMFATQPKLVFLANPNNPTGWQLPLEDLQRIIAACPGLLVVDEAYSPFAAYSAQTLLSQSPNVVMLRTLSKLGFAGARLGYLVAHPHWVAQINKVRPPYNVNVLTATALATLLSQPEMRATLQTQADCTKAERGRMAAIMAAIPGITVFPSHANFLLFRVVGQGAATEMFEGLKQAGILIKNLQSAHPLLQNCLRVTVSSIAENDRFLATLKILRP